MPGRPWDGQSERRFNSDHDTLVGLMEIIKMHEIRYAEDKVENEKKFDAILKTQAWQTKLFFMGMGFLTAVEAMPKIMDILSRLTK